MEQEKCHTPCPASVLFVCGMNSIRSPIAEALMHKFFPGICVTSAGIIKGECDPFAAVVIAEEGISLGCHNPRGLEDLAAGSFDLIVALTPQAHNVVLEEMGDVSVDVEYWPTPDPAFAMGSREQILDAYRDVREVLKKRITGRFTV